MLGPHIGLWWGNELARDFDALLRRCADWVQTIASAYFLISDDPLSVQLNCWVEALDVDVREAVLGFIDERFRVVRTPQKEAPPTHPVRRAIELAGRLGELADTHPPQRHLKPAAQEAWRAARDGTDEAFLSAFRALECLRRQHQGEDTSEKEAWEALQDELSADPAPCETLREAAKAVRHGDRPNAPDEAHAINRARNERAGLIDYAAELVRKSISAWPDLGFYPVNRPRRIEGRT